MRYHEITEAEAQRQINKAQHQAQQEAQQYAGSVFQYAQETHREQQRAKREQLNQMRKEKEQAELEKERAEKKAKRAERSEHNTEYKTTPSTPDNRAKPKKQEQLDALAGKGPIFQKIMTAGDKHYKSLCFACHGANGEGSPMAGTDTMLAPPLKGSKRVLGNKDKLIKIALHGLMGPVDGKTYPGAMESLASHDDKYISEVLTYIRNSWGNSAQLIYERDVKYTRRHNKKRKMPWTLAELK